MCIIKKCKNVQGYEIKLPLNTCKSLILIILINLPLNICKRLILYILHFDQIHLGFFSPSYVTLSSHISLPLLALIKKYWVWYIKKRSTNVGKKQQKYIAHKNHVFLRSHILLSNIIKHVSWLICISVYHLNNENYDQLIIFNNFLKREKIIH